MTHCTHDTYHETTSTTTSEVFGNLFDDYDQSKVEIEKFTDIEELLNASKIQIEDIVHLFQFGDEINVHENYKWADRKELLRQYWYQSVWPNKGYCYTFDPKLQNKSKMAVFTKDDSLLSIKLKLHVSHI